MQGLVKITIHMSYEVLIGDPKQLGPVVKNEKAGLNGLEESLFQKICEGRASKKPDAQLDIQHRMHSSMAELPLKENYSEEIHNAVDKERPVVKGFPWVIYYY